jgi:ubiquinone/menaquinone biosynthesis C-methylase UbiE
MHDLNAQIQDQYRVTGLFEDIVKRLGEQGVDLENVSRSDIAGIDELHLRGAEVSKELVSAFDFNHLRVLDVGCGIGGPARMLADEFNCDVSGIDMSREFIGTAQKLSGLIKMNGKTDFVHGNALDLPFENGVFDVVWTQHVQMNIEDKRTFYSEIYRVLKDNGALVYFDIFSTNSDAIYYPVPWANDASRSFLTTISSMEGILKVLQFAKIQSIDQTFGAIQFLKNAFEKIKKEGPAKLGINVVMGSSTKEKLGNVFKALQEGKIELQSGIYRK